MKLDLIGPDEKPRGTVEVPDEVVSAANVVGNYLRSQDQQTGIIAIAGVGLYKPLYVRNPPPTLDYDANAAVRLKCISRLCLEKCTSHCVLREINDREYRRQHPEPPPPQDDRGVTAQGTFWWKDKD